MSSHTAAAHGGQQKLSKWQFLMSMLGAIGVVYGDIGTSVLYSFREAFLEDLEASRENVLGFLSVLSLALFVTVTVKYVVFIMRVSHEGEGGITALITVLKKAVSVGFIILGVIGVNLLLGDGMITPAISVLSAVEGLQYVNPVLGRYAAEITIVILLMLFSIQRYGTEKVGKAFGPITLLWFIVIALLGARWISRYPAVLLAVNPYYAIRFFVHNQWAGFVALGSAFLAVTGGEALYADMGHFGRGPVKAGWLFVALPALLLNYYGQGALLILHPEYIVDPFYSMVPVWAKLPVVGIATLATIIASQALITGAFSLAKSLIQLHAIPPIEILGTSAINPGQIYVPLVNKVLLVGSISLVMFFKTSSNLAAAYGVAVAGTMGITTILWFLAETKLYKWSYWKAIPIALGFLVIDLAFLSANMLKFWHGGWIPLSFATVVTILMEVYYFRSRHLLALKKGRRPVAQPVEPEPANSFALGFIEEYAHPGVASIVNEVRNSGKEFGFVHIETRHERTPMLKMHLPGTCKEVQVLESPSGDIFRPAVQYVMTLKREKNAKIYAYIGQTIVPGESPGLHPNGDRLMHELSKIPNVIVVRVPWVAQEKKETSRSRWLMNLVPSVVRSFVF